MNGKNTLEDKVSNLTQKYEQLLNRFVEREKESRKEINGLRTEIQRLKEKHEKDIENLQLNIELKFADFMGRSMDNDSMSPPSSSNRLMSHNATNPNKNQSIDNNLNYQTKHNNTKKLSYQNKNNHDNINNLNNYSKQVNHVNEKFHIHRSPRKSALSSDQMPVKNQKSLPNDDITGTLKTLKNMRENTKLLVLDANYHNTQKKSFDEELSQIDLSSSGNIPEYDFELQDADISLVKESTPNASNGLTSIPRKTLENLTQLIESRSEELNFLIEVLTVQESSTAQLKQKVDNLTLIMNDLRKDLQNIKVNQIEGEDTVISLATQSSSLKECLATEIEENINFRKKLKFTLDQSSENFKSLFQKVTSFSSQLKMIQNQITHIEKSKRDKLSTEEDLYQIYMEQASAYDQRFNSLKLQHSKLEKHYKKVSAILFTFITKQWYTPPQEYEGSSDYRLHNLVYDAVRDFHANLLQHDDCQEMFKMPIKIQPIRSQQYKIHDRIVTIFEQNDQAIVKLRDQTVSLDEFLKTLFSVSSHNSPSRKSIKTSHLSGISLNSSKQVEHLNYKDGRMSLKPTSPPMNRDTPTLKIDLTTPRSPPLSNIGKGKDKDTVRLQVNLSEVDGLN